MATGSITADDSITYSITVSDLLRIPFALRSETEKLQIVLGDKPRPLLKLSGITFTEMNDIISHDFKASIYDEISWLTGCGKNNNMFCWPCLLFGSPSIWNSNGFSDIMILTNEALKHEKSLSHVEAVEKMYKFVEKEKKSRDETIKPKSQNSSSEKTQLKTKKGTRRQKCKEKVQCHLSENTNPPQFSHNIVHSTDLANGNDKKNAEITKRLIDACCLEFQLSHSNENFITNLFETEKYAKILQLLKSYDNCNTCLCNDAVHLIKNVPGVIETVFDAIVKFVEVSVKKEIQLSKYIGLVLNQHGEAESELKISVVLRYIKDDALVERFVGFTKVTDIMSVNVLYNIFVATLKKYKIGDKICALSLDGSILNQKDLCDFLDKIKNCHPNCLFLPWNGHTINHVLQQSLSSLPICRKFFMQMASIQTYFHENCEHLKILITEKHPALIHIYSNADTVSHPLSNRFATSQFIVTVKNFRQDFINLFDCVIKTGSPIIGDNIIKAFGFQKYLKELQTIFLLEILTRLFNFTFSLNSSLNNNRYNFCNGRQDNIVYDIVIKISKMQVGKYTEIWNNIKSIFPELSEPSEFFKMKQLYYSLFIQIISLTTQEINIRYQPIVKLRFLNMFNFETKKEFEQFPSWAESLSETNRQFNSELMKSELIVLSNDEVFSGKSAMDVHNFICQYDFHDTFKSLSKLSELIVVMLFKPDFQCNNASKLQTIEKWCDNSGSAFLDRLSFLYIEYDVYQSLKESLSFYDDVYSIYKDLKIHR